MKFKALAIGITFYVDKFADIAGDYDEEKFPTDAPMSRLRIMDRETDTFIGSPLKNIFYSFVYHGRKGIDNIKPYPDYD